ncbi:MAG TPA: type II CAAX endopeptidase family protein [Vicinamibacterales bacterium]
MAYARPILGGLAIVAAVLVPWSYAAGLSRDVRPDVPWAAIVITAWMALLVAWLHGFGPPASTSAGRRSRLRLWPPAPDRDAAGGGAGPIILLLAVLYIAWTAMSRLSPAPDLTAYPTTAYRWSMFLMGGLLSGVVEEVAYRGYMQTGLERIDRGNAIAITSVVFVLSHVTHGLSTLVVMAPGLFIASYLYGLLAQRTGTILPGILIHTAGDLSRMFFGVLRGDAGVLFVG